MTVPISILMIVFFCMGLNGDAFAQEEFSEEELEAWFNDDSQLHPQSANVDARNVNEGEIHFLSEPQIQASLTSRNVLNISKQSLLDGWVDVSQCHEHLDAFSAVEVVYRYKQVRKLRIISRKHIEKAWVEGQTVQMQSVKQGASICLALQAKVLYRDKDDEWILANGPFQRKFLDGYFPLHLLFEVNFPNELTFTDIKPIEARSFTKLNTKNKVVMNAWFEGKLVLQLKFVKTVR